ncbi:MAG: ABC transporter ATP-binding protein [Candidatus Electrothrix sp. Rat3]|uniref:ABC transporter ATP-binding protein n=1 Tax=Candidatus Electrothrix sp. TaxID=2170559 RepID=UPI00291C2AD1|nr:ABC transporter ATP-binding protein [Candidatus Electrothrix rattekaaiensis]
MQSEEQEMDTFLEVQQVNKIFRPDKEVEVIALRDINVRVKRGDFAVLSGPSGSGKTTLLNIIGCLDDASSGQILLDDEQLTGQPEKKLSLIRRDQIGFVFQAYNLIPVLTARENIEYIMKLQGRDQQECDDRVMEVARKLEIETLLKKLPSQLSGGQQQRVAVARAVAATPKLILADEPTANLDSKTAASLMDMMERLNEDEGVTVIFSSHDPMVIGKARHSIVLKDGEIISDERIH